jgi:hypothetical protein
LWTRFYRHRKPHAYAWILQQWFGVCSSHILGYFGCDCHLQNNNSQKCAKPEYGMSVHKAKKLPMHSDRCKKPRADSTTSRFSESMQWAIENHLDWD